MPATDLDTAPNPPPPTAQRRRPAGNLRRASAPWLFLAPAIVLFVVFLLIPIGYAIYLSFRGFAVDGGGAFGRRTESFIGFDNYVDALTDPEYLQGLGRVLIFAVIAIPAVIGLSLMFALLLDTPRVRGRAFSRTAIFLPYAVPAVIASLLWGFLYLPSTSPVNYIAEQLGGGPLDFFADPQLYLSLANIALWSSIGFNMIIIFTALRSVPTEIYEAARIDGANEFQIAVRIKIPLVTPALVLTGMFSVIGTLQLYSEPATLRPMTSTISSTWVPLMKIYQEAFVNDNLGGAAAASVILAVGILLLSLLILRVFQRKMFGEQS